MTLQQLVFFTEIAEKLNFTKAAESLYTSQSSLSHTIRSLEDELGVHLFVRSRGRQVVLSRYGEILYPYAKNVLDSLEQCRKDLDAAKGKEDRTIRISHDHSVASIYISAVICAYEDEVGEGRIIFQRDVNHIGYTPVKELMENKTDAIIVSKPVENPELENVPVAKQQLFVLLHRRHHLADRAAISIQDLNGETFSMLKGADDLYESVLNMINQSNMPPQRFIMYPEWGSMIASISTNQAVSITPRLGVATSITRHIPLDHKDSLRTLYLVFRKGHENEAMKEFVNYCLEYKKRNIIV